MLNHGTGAGQRKAFAVVAAGLAVCVSIASGCGKARDSRSAGSDDPRNKTPLVTCDLRCDWTAEGLIANLSFKNVSDSDVKLLKSRLLLGEEATELTWSPFEVARLGARIPYKGEAARIAAPTAADYQVLAPGEVVNSTVNVGSAYDVSAPGSYRIRYASVNFSPDAQKRIDIASNVVQIARPGSP
jgi:hypothetical protein